MAKEKNKQEEKKLEREYIISVRKQVNYVPRQRKTEKAITTIKEFIAKHMKVEDRDKRKVRLDRYLNEYMWSRGIRNPPMKVKVKAIKDSEGIVRVELVDYPKNLEFKKKKEDKFHAKVETVKGKKEEKAEEKPVEKKQDSETKKEEAEKKEEAKEKEQTSKVAEQNLEKIKHKELKHETPVEKPTMMKGDHSKGKQKH